MTRGLAAPVPPRHSGMLPPAPGILMLCCSRNDIQKRHDARPGTCNDDLPTFLCGGAKDHGKMEEKSGRKRARNEDGKIGAKKSEAKNRRYERDGGRPFIFL